MRRLLLACFLTVALLATPAPTGAAPAAGPTAAAFPAGPAPETAYLVGRVLHTAAGDVVRLPFPKAAARSLTLLGRGRDGWVVLDQSRPTVRIWSVRDGRAHVFWRTTDWESSTSWRLSRDGTRVLQWYADRDGYFSVATVLDLDGSVVRKRRFNGYGEVLDLTGDRALLNANLVDLWDFGTNTTRKYDGPATLGDIDRDLAFFADRDGFSAPYSLEHPDEPAWSSRFNPRVVSPAGDLVAGTDHVTGQRVQLRSMADGTKLAVLALHYVPGDPLAWEPDGDLIVGVRSERGRALLRCTVGGCERATPWARLPISVPLQTHYFGERSQPAARQAPYLAIGRLPRGADADLTWLERLAAPRGLPLLHRRSGAEERLPALPHRVAYGNQLLGPTGDGWVATQVRQKHTRLYVVAGGEAREFHRAYDPDGRTSFLLSRNGLRLLQWTSDEELGTVAKIFDLDGVRVATQTWPAAYGQALFFDGGRVILSVGDQICRWHFERGTTRCVDGYAEAALPSHDLAFVRAEDGRFGPTSLAEPAAPTWLNRWQPRAVSRDGQLVAGRKETGKQAYDLLQVRSVADGSLVASYRLAYFRGEKIWWEDDHTIVFETSVTDRGFVLVRCDVTAGRCRRASDYVREWGFSVPFQLTHAS